MTVEKLINMTQPLRYGKNARIHAVDTDVPFANSLKVFLVEKGIKIMEEGYADFAYSFQSMNEMTHAKAALAANMVRKPGVLFVVGNRGDKQADIASTEMLLASQGMLVDICGYMDTGDDNEKAEIPVVRAGWGRIK